jgi:tetratricopeptide (TPR) repeat protein
VQHQKVVDEFPEYGLGYYGLSKLQRYLGENELAIETNSTAMDILGDSTLVQIAAAECLAADGKRAEALAKLRELNDVAIHRFVSPYMLAMVYSFIGDDEKVLEHLKHSLEAREAWLCCSPVEARFEKYFENDPFQSILKAINHPMAGQLPKNALGSEITREFGDLTTVLIDDSI